MRQPDEMPDILRRIVTTKREELERQRQMIPLGELKERAARLPAARSLAGALRAGPAGVPSPRIRVIAEVKAASPSAGRLMDGDRRAGLPLLYAESGAAAISVLTEKAHFQGDLRHLTEARETLHSRFGDGAPPLLRKDFLFDAYQVWESKAYGADAILLIIAILSRERLAGLLSLAGDLGLDCLVEAHDEGE
ncbi:MAG TPA: indole-3-glycerol phosphate synthase TrpC, partial [Dehalococcoidia bacterium]|nr:indole-3-glycerol phosphate synthase TrpC [Dehalococcoidia bacterium]